MAEGEFSPIKEHESYAAPKSKPTVASPHNDHIKQIVRVNEEDYIDDVQTRPTPEEDSSGSPTSSGEDAPVFKIDREAILKSLSSMARRNALDYDEDNRSTDEDSWGGSSHFALSQVDEYEQRSVQVDELGRQYMALSDEKHCAHPWCAIAAFPDSCQTTRATNLDEKIDKTLQRSLSLVALTSDGNDCRKTEECSHEECATIEAKTDKGQFEQLDECHEMEHSAAESVKSSEDSEERIEAEHLEMIIGSGIVDDQINLESVQHNVGEQSSSPQASITGAALGSNVHDGPSSSMPHVAFELVQSSLPSPKSVLQPTCSVASFDHYVDDEIHQFNVNTAQVSSPIARQNSAVFMEHSADFTDFDGEEVGVYEVGDALPMQDTKTYRGIITKTTPGVWGIYKRIHRSFKTTKSL